MSLKLGPYEADLTTQKVTRHGQPVQWGDKASVLFIQLLSQTPKTISKEAIFAHVWKDRVVTENSLYKIISKLRQALNADDIEVESVFGEGYRIVSKNPVSTHTSQPQKLNKMVLLLAGLLLAVVTSWFVFSQVKQQRLYTNMQALQQVMAVTKQAFISQVHRRNELGELLAQRFELNKADSWEKRFYNLYDQMNEPERFLCQQTRAYTEGPLYENNRAALQLMLDNKQITDELPLAQDLITHLTIWLNKYERVFMGSEKMCLLYVGVEDGAAFPSGFDQQLADWLEANQ